MTVANFEDVLLMISSLAMKGSFFVGELPVWFADIDTEIIVSLQLVYFLGLHLFNV